MGTRSQGTVSATGVLTVVDVTTVDEPSVSAAGILSVGTRDAPDVDVTSVSADGILTSSEGVGVEYLVVIAWHQSNMAGAHRTNNGATLIAADDPVEGIYQYAPVTGGGGQPALTLEQAVNPLPFPTIGAGLYTATVGPAFAYAKALLAANPSKKIVLITAGRGGTGLGEWAPGQQYYTDTITAWDTFRAAYPSCVLHSHIASILESEMQNATAPATVATMLDTWINGLRDFTDGEEAPIYWGSPPPTYVSTLAHRAVLLEGAKAATRFPLIGISGGLVAGEVGGDVVHYTNTSNRTRGQWLFDQIALTPALTAGAPPAIDDLTLSSQTLTFTSVGAPYYTIQVRATSGDDWVDTDFVPNQNRIAGEVFSITMPGYGTRECQVLAKSYGGTSTSNLVSWTLPAVSVPTPVVQLDFDNATLSGSDYTSIPSNGSDTGAWVPGATTVPVFTFPSGAKGATLGTSGRFNRSGYTFPAGDYTLFFPLMATSVSNNIMMAWAQASASGDIFAQFGGDFSVSGRNNASNSTVVQTATGLFEKDTYVALAITYARTANQMKIYVNGALAVTGTPQQRSASPSNSGGTSFYGYLADGTGNGIGGVTGPPALWNQVLTQSELERHQYDTQVDLGITFAINIHDDTGLEYYEPEALDLFDRFTTPADDTRKGHINTLIASLKTGAISGSNIWAKLPCLYVMAAADAQAAQRNWISDTFNLTPVSSPTFTADRGYAGNGSSSYLTTGFDPASSSALFTQNDNSFGNWVRNNVQSNSAGDFGNHQFYVNGRIGSNNVATVDATTSNNAVGGGLITDSTAQVSVTRAASGSWTTYRNGASMGSTAVSSSTLDASAPFLIGARNNSGTPGNFSSRQQAAVFWGSSLSANEVQDVYNALNTYLVAVGAA